MIELKEYVKGTFIEDNAKEIMLEYLNDIVDDTREPSKYVEDIDYEILQDYFARGCITTSTTELNNNFHFQFDLDDIIDMVSIIKDEFLYNDLNMYDLELILTKDYMYETLRDYIEEVREVDLLDSRDKSIYVLAKSLENEDMLDIKLSNELDRIENIIKENNHSMEM